MTDIHTRDPDTGLTRLETERLASPAVAAMEAIRGIMTERGAGWAPRYYRIALVMVEYDEARKVALGLEEAA